MWVLTWFAPSHFAIFIATSHPQTRWKQCKVAINIAKCDGANQVSTHSNIKEFFSTPCISMSTHCHWHNPILSTHLECWLIYEFDHNKQIINCVTRILSHVRPHFEAGLYSPHIFSGASSSSKMGCCRNNSLDLRHNPRTSASVIWTVFPGRLPRTGRIKTSVLY